MIDRAKSATPSQAGAPSTRSGPDAGGRVTRGTEVDPTDRAHALVDRFRLVVTSGPDKAKSFVSSGERSVIGTHESADFRLTAETVSRFHCEIDTRTGKAVLRDLGSLNGTFVDGVSVLAANLQPSARITLG